MPWVSSPNRRIWIIVLIGVNSKYNHCTYRQIERQSFSFALLVRIELIKIYNKRWEDLVIAPEERGLSTINKIQIYPGEIMNYIQVPHIYQYKIDTSINWRSTYVSLSLSQWNIHILINSKTLFILIQGRRVYQYYTAKKFRHGECIRVLTITKTRWYIYLIRIDSSKVKAPDPGNRHNYE